MASGKDNEEYVHHQLLADGTAMRVVVRRRTQGWVARLEIDGSESNEPDSPFFGTQQEDVVLIEGEELGDRGTVPPRGLDILVPHMDASVDEHGCLDAWGLAVGGRAPLGSSSISVEGTDWRFRVDPRSGLFCAARWWRPAPLVAVLEVSTDDPAVAPYRWEDSPGRWDEMIRR